MPANDSEMSSQCNSSSSAVSLPEPVSFPETISNPLVVFGSRSYERMGSARELGERLVSDLEEAGIQFDAIVSGGARGADRAGEVAGVLSDTPVVVFNVNGVDDRHHWYADQSDALYQVETVSSSDGDDDLPGEGRREPYMLRNDMMAEFVADRDGSAWAIWNGESTGTRAMLTSCRRRDLSGDQLTVQRFDKWD